MKWNFLFFLLLTSSLLITGCGDDDDNSNNDLVGSWTLIDYESSGSSITSFIGITTETGFQAEGDNYNYVVNFDDDGTYTIEGSFDVELSFTVDGNPDPGSQTITITDAMGSGTYSVSGNTMRVEGDFVSANVSGTTTTDPGAPQDIPFTLDGNRLTLTQTVNDNIDQGGVTSMVNSVSISVFERQ